MKSNNRYLGALLLSPLIIFLFLGGIYLKVACFILSIMGMYEFYKASKAKNIKTIPIIGYIACTSYYFFGLKVEFLAYIMVLMTFILLMIPVLNLKYNFIDMAVTLLGFLYVGVFFSFVSVVSYKTHGNYMVWLIFIASWLCDTTAYYTGRFFGKNKLCPKVSPKKTVEGSIGGLIGSTLACGIYGISISKYVTSIPVYHYFIIGALCGIFCQFGDLVASSIKRFADIKDYSNLIPGHGGIMDRFDSILFASVIVYFYITLIIAI